MKQKSVKIATLKDWLISKIVWFDSAPKSSMRYQEYYFTLIIPAPIDFNAFVNYYRATIKGKKVEKRLYITMKNWDRLTVDELVFGDIKKDVTDMRITIWLTKTKLEHGFYKGWTGRPARITSQMPPPRLYSSVSRILEVWRVYYCTFCRPILF